MAVHKKREKKRLYEKLWYQHVKPRTVRILAYIPSIRDITCQNILIYDISCDIIRAVY